MWKRDVRVANFSLFLLQCERGTWGLQILLYSYSNMKEGLEGCKFFSILIPMWKRDVRDGRDCVTTSRRIIVIFDNTFVVYNSNFHILRFSFSKICEILKWKTYSLEVVEFLQYSELELRVRDLWITNQFLDPTNQKFVKLPFFTNWCFQNRIYSKWIRLNEWDWLMKNKNFVECFGLFKTTSLYINMKNYKNIACTFFVNVNIALNLNSYEGN